MNHNDIAARIRAFLSLLEGTDGEHPSVDWIAALSLALDELAVASHQPTYIFDYRDYPDPPRREYEDVRHLVTSLLPELGFYNVAEHTTVSVGESGCNVGDAVDDVSDIALELYEVEWRWNHTSVEDALWHLEDGYNRHWGDHLRCLQLYLYRIRGGS